MTLEKIRRHDIWIMVFCAGILLPWLMMQLDTRIPGDAAFLFTGAKYFAQGLSMKEYFYDNNPPMCFLVYLPAVLLNALGLSAPTAITLYTMALIAISTAFIFYFVSRNALYTALDKSIIMSGFLCAVTLLCFPEFGQKDQFIAIALVPFLLAQQHITEKKGKPDVISFLCLIFWLPFILIKPHYGLLPAGLIAHRIYKNKTLNPLRHPDAVCLALGCIFYAAVCVTFFSDYIFEILPQAFSLYAVNNVGFQTTKYALALLFVCSTLLAILLMSNDSKEKKESFLLFPAAAILTTLVFWIQNKGFSLHLLPVFPFSLISVMLVLKQFMPSTYGKTMTRFCALLMLLIFSLGYATQISLGKIPSHKDYAGSSLAKIIKEKAGDDAYFFQASSTNIFYTQSLYLDNKIGSRFSSLWLLNNISYAPEDKQEAELNALYDMVAQDLHRFKPRLIGLIAPKENRTELGETFKHNENLEKEWQNYTRNGSITLTKNEFHDFLYNRDENASVTYNLYVRSDN